MVTGGDSAAGFLKDNLIIMFDIDYEEVDKYSSTFTKEPEFKCPACGDELHTDWVDNGFGPYSVQASPYGCECGWHETGCSECIKERCFSWVKCQGKALIVKPAVQADVNYNMNNNLDPNSKPEEVKESTADAVAPASEQATEQEQVPVEEKESAEEAKE